MRESKECLECGGIYYRPEAVSQAHWEERKYCSVACASKVGLRRKADRREEGLDISDKKPGTFEPRQPIMRELRIVRVGPNPQMVVCEYYELAERRTCTVRVRRTQKFVRGMRLRMAEPAGEMEFARPWVYSGPAPRHRGRW